jgi:hypothetical protein
MEIEGNRLRDRNLGIRWTAVLLRKRPLRALISRLGVLQPIQTMSYGERSFATAGNRTPST